MPKQKPHKGLLKRIRVTASGKVKAQRAFSGHLNSHMTGKKLRQLRLKRLLKSGDIKRVSAMLCRRLRPGG
jgi:large subunit ribosomal protein L35